MHVWMFIFVYLNVIVVFKQCGAHDEGIYVRKSEFIYSLILHLVFKL